MENYDVVIIGAGPAGLTSAYELTKHNKKVLVLEKKTESVAKTEATPVAKTEATPVVKTEATPVEQAENSVATVQEVLGDMMGDAPACNECGHITIRNGSCYKCLNCGNSLGCS